VQQPALFDFGLHGVARALGVCEGHAARQRSTAGAFGVEVFGERLDVGLVRLGARFGTAWQVTPCSS
jgi:hypothetical protein